MAISQLALYNDALLLLGQRRLASLTEAREPRYRLDDIYGIEALEFCFEMAKPTFARETNILSAPTTSSQHGLDSVHTLPGDYISMVAVYSDDKLDQPLNRYILEGDTIACEFATIYIRFISNASVTSFTDWTPAFARVVSAYLARELAARTSPDKYADMNAQFDQRVEDVISLDARNEPAYRSSAPTVTLTNSWRVIYNDALLILGLDEITSNNDDSDRRAKLDRALDAGLVESVLEDTSWTFGLSSVKITFDPSLEPEFGYTRVHQKPSDMQIINGVYQDEYMREALRYYKDEGSHFFSDLDTIYVEFVSTDFLTNPSNWPAYFRRLIAGKLARDAAASINEQPENIKIRIQRSEAAYQDRKEDAMSIDVMNAPPRILARGEWTSARFRGGDRNRPGNY